jgi:hypothetical protein
MPLYEDSSYTLDDRAYDIGHTFALYSPSGNKLLTLMFDKDGFTVRCAPHVGIVLHGKGKIDVRG